MNRHRCIAFGVLLATATGLCADPDADALEGWTVFGTEKAALSTTAGLSLPSGAQLYRPVGAANVTVRMKSSPAFAATADELPVLEVGPAALVFLNQAGIGRLVLVLESSAPLALPFAFALDANGRSAEPLAVTLGWRGTSVVVAVDWQTLHFPAGPHVGAREIMISAGAGAAWPIAGLEVEEIPATGTVPPDLDGHSPAPTAEEKPVMPSAPSARSPSAQLVAEAAVGAPQVESTNRGGASAKPVRQRNRGLELYSPSAVRRGRTAEVRAAVAEQVSRPERAEVP